MAMIDRLDSAPDDTSDVRIGLYGGTFDPIHIGHLIMAEEARVRLDLDRVIFIPARVSPLKQEGTFFSAEDRCRMVELAISDNDRFRVSRIDIERQGPSFTVDTLRAFRECHGAETAIHFIMGMDSLCSIGDWHNPAEIIRLAHIVAISRPGFEPDLGKLELEVPGLVAATSILPSLAIGISSTDIRSRLEAGLPIRYQVPSAVESFIYRHLRRKDLPVAP